MISSREHAAVPEEARNWQTSKRVDERQEVRVPLKLQIVAAIYQFDAERREELKGRKRIVANLRIEAEAIPAIAERLRDENPEGDSEFRGYVQDVVRYFEEMHPRTTTQEKLLRQLKRLAATFESENVDAV